MFTNFGTASARASFTIRPASYALVAGTHYKLQTARLDGVWIDVPSTTFDGGAASVTFGPITIAAPEDDVAPPWAVYRIVRAN